MTTGSLISKQKAAHDLDVSLSTIDRLRIAGEIETIKVGRSVRVVVASLEGYKARQREQAAAEQRAAHALAPERSAAARPVRRRCLPHPRDRRAAREAEGRLMGQRAPSKAEIASLKRSLKPGQQKAITPGIYVRLNADGTLGFQAKLRLAGANSRCPAKTFDNWTDADKEYRRRLEEKENGSDYAWREQQRMLATRRPRSTYRSPSDPPRSLRPRHG